jgi:pseudouridine synthase
LIEQGRVKVDGELAMVGMRVNSLNRIEVDGKLIKPFEKKLYLLLNKPKGFLTTVQDEWGRKNVLSLVKGAMRESGMRVYPVGRLDKNTEGLLLLTNDGDLAYRLTHPSFSVPKTYLVEVKGHPGFKVINQIRKGVLLEDGLTRPAQVELLERRKRTTLLKMVLKEGRKREIRRVWRKFGFTVVCLKRIALGPLELGHLNPGCWRFLEPKEVKKLKQLVGLSD